MNSSDGIGGSERHGELEEQLLAVEEEVRRVPTKDQVDRIGVKATRNAKIGIAISILVALFAVAFSTWNTLEIADTAAQSALTAEGIESLQAANEKLREQGLPEIPLPRDGDEIDADALAAAAAALMYDLIKNDPQFEGPRGPRGEPCVPEVPGCTGQPGTPGRDGAEGQDGDSGSDGAPGESPPCLNEPSQCRGPDGRGIHDLSLQPNGDLFVFYTNAVDEAVFLGNIMGPPGAPGSNATACPADFPVQAQRTFLTPGLVPGEETVVVCTQG